MELFEHMRQTSTSQTQPLFLDKTDLLVLSQWSFLKPLLERERAMYCKAYVGLVYHGGILGED
jgi:hypothetical protein